MALFGLLMIVHGKVEIGYIWFPLYGSRAILAVCLFSNLLAIFPISFPFAGPFSSNAKYIESHV